MICFIGVCVFLITFFNICGKLGSGGFELEYN